MYKWLASQVCYRKWYDEDAVSFIKTRCRQEILNSIDLDIWSIVDEIEDLSYNDEAEYYKYVLRIKFSRYRDE